MNFKELSQCPFCGCRQFYTINYMSGYNAYFQRFDGAEPENNEDMYDGLIIREGKKAYCQDCNRYLGSSINDTVGKRAERAFIKNDYEN